MHTRSAFLFLQLCWALVGGAVNTQAAAPDPAHVMPPKMQTFALYAEGPIPNAKPTPMKKLEPTPAGFKKCPSRVFRCICRPK